MASFLLNETWIDEEEINVWRRHLEGLVILITFTTSSSWLVSKIQFCCNHKIWCFDLLKRKSKLNDRGQQMRVALSSTSDYNFLRRLCLKVLLSGRCWCSLHRHVYSSENRSVGDGGWTCPLKPFKVQSLKITLSLLMFRGSDKNAALWNKKRFNWRNHVDELNQTIGFVDIFQSSKGNVCKIFNLRPAAKLCIRGLITLSCNLF